MPPITRFVVALMDVGLGMCEANTKASRLLPAPQTHHATTIMVFICSFSRLDQPQQEFGYIHIPIIINTIKSCKCC